MSDFDPAAPLGSAGASASVPASRSTPSSLGSPIRRERAVIAAQACETCRSRKSKCDEARPKCGLCQRLNVECRYREPQATKKDKTAMSVAEMMLWQHHKTNAIGRILCPDDPLFKMSYHINSNGSVVVDNPPPHGYEERLLAGETFPRLSQFGSISERARDHHLQLTAPHKVLLWPAVYKRLTDEELAAHADLDVILREGTPWFVHLELEKHPGSLPCDDSLTSQYMDSPGGPTIFFQDLSLENVHLYSTEYFNRFNVLHPILDPDVYQDTLKAVSQYGFSFGSHHSIIVLLVCALGKVALEGVSGTPLKPNSGIRGGTAERPPGLELFNEARRRIGYVMTECHMENIQVHLLVAVYYSASCRHMDFWRSLVAACSSCQIVLACQPLDSIDWNSTAGNSLKNVYWTCNLIESWLHFELDLKPTGIMEFEDSVPLPASKGAATPELQQWSLTHMSLIALRKLITRVHTTIYDSSTETTNQNACPPLPVVHELRRQLVNWRTVLPECVQWSDEEPFTYPKIGGSRPSQLLFLEKGYGSSKVLPYSLDMFTAQLRTRYYYTDFMIHRPFVYKCLHFPNNLLPGDQEAAARCLRSAMEWPIAMAPIRDRKRLIPFSFVWTQNFLGILIIVRMAIDNPTLNPLLTRLHTDDTVNRNILRLLDWMEDMAGIDSVAKWGWKIVANMFSVEKPFPY
ncbi:hypothetical protein BDY21DRAFT_372456 [Lineolata rhizophorae]|uniref:Zn(2)-C6 fungal-type domain-containing protein n=1 Tax=Lineolata rhizophorae TaxID=578093 RepID=A0A6A6NX54_9PEZI|nr:hypothetical protein BDY21DRAFT_372456 [Lineolata rhizophorae]